MSPLPWSLIYGQRQRLRAPRTYTSCHELQRHKLWHFHGIPGVLVFFTWGQAAWYPPAVSQRFPGSWKICGLLTWATGGTTVDFGTLWSPSDWTNNHHLCSSTWLCIGVVSRVPMLSTEWMHAPPEAVSHKSPHLGSASGKTGTTWGSFSEHSTWYSHTLLGMGLGNCILDKCPGLCWGK
jgi:hypothetical protein